MINRKGKERLKDKEKTRVVNRETMEGEIDKIKGRGRAIKVG